MNIKILFLFLSCLLGAKFVAFSQVKDTLCYATEEGIKCWVAEKYPDTIFCDISQCYHLTVTLEVSYDTCQPNAEGWRYSTINNVSIAQLWATSRDSLIFVSFAPANMNSLNTYGFGAYATGNQIIKDTAEVARVVPIIENILKKCFIGNPCKDNFCSFWTKHKQKYLTCDFRIFQDFIVVPEKKEYLPN